MQEKQERSMPRFRTKNQIWQEVTNQENGGMDKISFENTFTNLGVNSWKLPNRKNCIINYDQLIDDLIGNTYKKETSNRKLPRFRTEVSIIEEVLSDEETAANEEFVKYIIRKANAIHCPIQNDEHAELGYIVNYDKLIDYLYERQ